MPTPTFSFPARSRGFTLVETIVVMVVMAIAAAGISFMSGNIFNSQDDNTTLQVGMKLIQECSEHILAVRRDPSTSWATFTPSCPNPGVTGFTPSVTTTSSYTGVGCPTGLDCKLVEVSMTTGGSNMTPITLLLVGP